VPSQPAEQPQPAAEPARRPMADQERRTKAPKFNGKDYWTWSFRFSSGPFRRTCGPSTGVCRGQARGGWRRAAALDRRSSRAFAELCNALEPDDLIRLIREFGAAERVEPAAQAGQPPAHHNHSATAASSMGPAVSFYVQRQLGPGSSSTGRSQALHMDSVRLLSRIGHRQMSRVRSMPLRGDHGLPVVDAESHHGLGPHWEMFRVVINSQFGTLQRMPCWFL